MPKKSTKTASKTRQKAATKPKLSAYILLDRSGSMGSRMAEALSAINTYVETLAEAVGIGAEVTVAAFDQYGAEPLSFSVLRRRVPVGDWKNLTGDDVFARGGTPLYDAIDRIVFAAEVEDEKRTSIVIITDGANNAGTMTRETAKSILDKCRAREWDVKFLGADWDAFAQAAFVGINRGETINTRSGFYGQAMGATARNTVAYVATGMGMMYSDKDRANALGQK